MAMWHCGAEGSIYRASVGKPDGKRPLGTSRRKWKDNIKMDLKEMRWKVVDWTDLPQNRDR
jgi:rubredoxin